MEPTAARKGRYGQLSKLWRNPPGQLDRLWGTLCKARHGPSTRTRSYCFHLRRKVSRRQVQSLQSDQGAVSDPRPLCRQARSDRQLVAVSGNLPRPDGSDCPAWSGRRARACDGALGHARTTTVRRRADHKHPQFGSPHWRGWLGKRNRCVVPATSFCEYADTKPRKTPMWFALSENRPLFAFAGLWMPIPTKPPV
jgi:putative SOS response-associated peptidase YedK